jgi:opacity protein-like surface antigen
MRMLRLGILTLAMLAARTGLASADATLFIGTASDPSHRSTRGLAVSAEFLIAGVEFEYASTSTDSRQLAPSLRTGMMNLFLQSPVAIGGVRPYVTAGAGCYRERLGDSSETQAGFNVGGGVKVGLAGPLGARVDYRRLALAGSPLYPRQHRLYAGMHLTF